MIVVFTYHSVSGLDYEHAVSARRFRLQMRILKMFSHILPVEEVVAMAKAGRAAPGRFSAVTFDDGLRDNLVEAAPVLRELGIPATVFMVSSLVGARHGNAKLPDGFPMLSADDLRALDAEGLVRIEAHTHTHPVMRGMPEAEVEAECRESKRVLEGILGRPVSFLAYPKGAADPSAEAAAGRVFEAAFVGENRAADPGRDRLFALPRVIVDRSFPLWKFFLMLFPAYWRLRAWRDRLLPSPVCPPPA